MNWRIKSTLLLLLVSSSVLAEDSPLRIVAETCLKDETMEVCKNLSLVKDNLERKVNRQLQEWGMVNGAIFVGMAMQYAATKKLELKSNSRWSSYFPSERSILIDENNTFFILLTWPMEF